MDNKEKILSSVSENRGVIIGTFFIFLILITFYYTSKNYRVSNTLKKMENIALYLSVNTKINNSKLRLCDFYISSAFRPYISKNQHFDYIDLEITKKIIVSGVRAMYVDIFNSHMGDNAEPVISVGFSKGEWKLSLNKIYFDDFCRLLALCIFSPGYVNNFEDPFFLMLNLNTNRNHHCLNKIKKIIFKRFKRHLLGNKYSYAKVNLAEESIQNFRKKIVIMSSGGYENSDLEELINHTWKKESLRKIDYESLDPEVKVTKSIKINSSDLKEYNKNNLTIVTPNESKFFTHNYHPNYFFDTGCQFVCLNYTLVDTHFDKYITKFRRDSFIEKPKAMRGSPKNKEIDLKPNPKILEDTQFESQSKLQCPEKPDNNYDIRQDKSFVEIFNLNNSTLFRKKCIGTDLITSGQTNLFDNYNLAKQSCSSNLDCKGISYESNKYKLLNTITGVSGSNGQCFVKTI